MRRLPLLLFGLLACTTSGPRTVGQERAERVRLTDDFESGLANWDSYGSGIAIIPSGDANHGKVLSLSPNGDVHVLAKGSDSWGPMRIEGDVLFPDSTDSYLGVMYNARKRGHRWDFGLIYIKGDGSYLQANPHRDYNVSRTFYPEFRAELEGVAATRIGVWQRFRVEVVDRVAHFYVGDMETPRLIFPFADSESGSTGLQPRSVGGDVWLDNVTITSIRSFSYRGRPPTSVTYAPDSLLTAWRVAGPFTQTNDAIARTPGAHDEWRTVAVDARGGVPTATIVDFHGPNTVAYFRTRVTARDSGRVMLHVSTLDDLALWVNGRFHWFIPRAGVAWHDFWLTQSHAGRRIHVTLNRGVNDLVFRVRGGSYATGGFFMRLEH
jgi:hypothetical protein